MLVATRDPPLYSGVDDGSRAARHAGARAAPGVTRLMTALQIAGSVLAIPVGLASGYSIYRANFSAEAQCQSLRTNIISMLDKTADASTLRMLARRDVAAFEGACGTVDPDAVAAFKTLFAAGRAAPATARIAAPPMPVVREAVQQPNGATKPAAAKTTPAAVEAKPVEHEAAASDAAWLAAVRSAIIHTAEQAPPAHRAPATVEELAPTVSRPPVHETRVLTQTFAPAASQAPALAPATTVVAAPAPAADAEHPVPPASIVGPSMDEADAAVGEDRSGHGFGSWMARFPVFGRALAGIGHRR